MLTLALAFWFNVASFAEAPTSDPGDRTATTIKVGEPHPVAVLIPAADRATGTTRYTVEPSPDVTLIGARTGTLTWNPATNRELALPLQFLVGRSHSPGPLVAARVALQWPDGARESIDVRVVVIQPAGAATSSKDIEAELIPVPRAAAPGGVVKLLYTIFSYEDTDERVRLRVDAGPGWRLLDPDVERRELFLEAWEEIEGELYLVLPEDARIGDRQLVQLLVEVVGEPGEIEAQNYVSVVKRGGAKPGVPTLSGTSTFGLSRLGVGGFDAAQRSGALTLSSKFAGQSSISVSYDQGLAENLSNFRYAEEPTRVAGNLRHAGWDITFGNRVSSPGHALAGPYVRGVGASLRRTSGRLVGDLAVARPAVFGGAASGHLVRARAGLRTSRATIAFNLSDFGRPAGGYTTLPPVQQTLLDPDAEEQLAIERQQTTGAASNRVQGMGLDAEFRPVRAHRIALRAGALSLSNAAGARVAAPAGEASYSYSAQPATFNLRWRQAPPAVPGISIPGDELAADGSVRMGGNLRMVGRVYQNSSETLGSDFFSSGEGASLGLRYTRNARRLEVRGNYRESQFNQRNVRRTVSALFGTPVGPLSFGGNADVGEQDNGTRVDRMAFFRGHLRWTGSAGTVSFSMSHSETSGLRRRRADLLASVEVRRMELAGGAWATRGYTSGGRPGLWTSVGLPVGEDRLLTLGVDYSPLTWISEPSLRGMVAIRHRFMLPVPFLRAAPM